MTTRLRRLAVELVTLIGILFWAAAPIGASPYDAVTDAIPSPEAVYEMEGPGATFTTAQGTYRYHEWRWRNAVGSSSPTQTDPDTWRIDSFFDVFTEVSLSLNGLPPGEPVIATMRGQMTGLGVGTSVRTFDTEMLSLNVVCNPCAGPFMIRESPTLRSTGQTTITSLPAGNYRIDSFFDVFTELSLDGGQSWIPADGPVHMASTPEPGTALLVGAGMVALAMRRRSSK